MKRLFLFLTAGCSLVCAQGGPRPEQLAASPQAVGEAGVVWYTTWETALKEAKRSNRPIFFMAAAATCNGVSGVFWPGYTQTQNSLFSQDDFITLSREFVCARLESYESKEHQDLIRSFLRGSFANTAFCILAPDGKTRLSRSGRSPSSLLGRGGKAFAGSEQIIAELSKISSKYRTQKPKLKATVPDFHTTRQALNVAAGDQRLLLLTVAAADEKAEARGTLLSVLNHPSLIGRFHHDYAAKTNDDDWGGLVHGSDPKSGFLIVRTDPFGQSGQVVANLPLSVEINGLKKALLRANAAFAKDEKRKVYREHVHEGRRKGVYFENGMPYGEDRDGDGVIDKKRERGRGRR